MKPDLTTMGKVAAGGMPGGIVCGSERMMSVLSRQAAHEGIRVGQHGQQVWAHAGMSALQQ